MTAAASKTSGDPGSAHEVKAKDNNGLCILRLFSHSEESSLAACTTSGDPHISCSSLASGLVNLARTSSIAKSLQEGSTTCEAGLVRSYYATQSCDIPGGQRPKVCREVMSVHVSGEGQPDQKPQEGPDQVSGIQNEHCYTILTGHSPLKLATDSQKKPLNVAGVAEAGPLSQCTGAGDCIGHVGDEIDLLKTTSGNIRQLASKISISPLVDAPESSLLCKNDTEASLLYGDGPICEAQKGCSRVVEENVRCNLGGSPTCTLDHCTRNKHMNTGKPHNFTNGNCWVSRKVQHGDGNGSSSDDSDTPVLDGPSAPSISPKDVIHAVGQQQFWKARSVILRQWHIFSDQVFELHKVIKVQQLLAEIPNVVVNEEKSQETVAAIPEHDAGVSAKKAKHLNKKEHSPRKDVEKSQLPGSVSQPGPASCHPRWSQVLKNDPKRPIQLGTFTSMPALIPGGMTAWVYPSLGTRQWLEPMATHSSVFVYQPSAESLSTGSKLSRASGPAMLGSGSRIWSPTMAPFTFPGFEQNPEFLPDMHSRNGPAIASFHQWNPAMYYNFPHCPVAPDLIGSWYAMQCNRMMKHNQRSRSIGNEKNVPSNLVASMTFCEKESMNTLKISHFPGTQPCNGMNGHTGESDTEDMDSSICQGQRHSLSVAAGSNVNAADAFSEKAKSGCQEDPEWAQRRGDCDNGGGKIARQAEEWGGRVIKVVPRAAIFASESTAEILLSIQQERRQ